MPSVHKGGVVQGRLEYQFPYFEKVGITEALDLEGSEGVFQLKRNMKAYIAGRG